MAGRLEGKIAIVTGAGSGIGRACALRFAREGAEVYVNDLHRDAAEAVASEIAGAGGKAVAKPGDVSEAGVIDAVVASAKDRHGRLDVLLNNAALAHGSLVAELEDDAWRRCLEVTLEGTLRGVRAAVKTMVLHGGGSIVNMASGAGLGGEFMLGAYGAAKAGVINLTQTAAVENARHGVRVNVVCPGPIDTPPLRAWIDHVPGGREGFESQIPAKRIGKPEEVAAAVLFLASDEASYVNGSVLCVDGAISARTAAPRFD